MKNKKDFFSYLGLSSIEIDELEKKCPGLRLADTKNIVNCVFTVIKNGYPFDDITSLILINPYFLLDTPEGLDKKITALGDNFIEKIKLNPKLL